MGVRGSGGGDGAGGGSGGAAVVAPGAGDKAETILEDGVGLGDRGNVHHLLKREQGQVGVLG